MSAATSICFCLLFPLLLPAEVLCQMQPEDFQRKRLCRPSVFWAVHHEGISVEAVLSIDLV